MKRKRKAWMLCALLLSSLLAGCGARSDAPPERESFEIPASRAETDAPPEPVSIYGTIDHNVYRNDYLQLQCTRLSGWEYFSPERVRIWLGGGIVPPGSEDPDEPALPELCFVDTNNGYSKLMLFVTPGDAFQAMYTPLELLEESQRVMPTTLKSVGGRLIDSSITTLELCGRVYDCLCTTYRIRGQNLTQYDVVLCNNETCFSWLEITLLQNEGLEDVLNSFDGMQV